MDKNSDKDKKYRGLLIDPVAHKVTEVQVGQELEEWYQLLDVDTVDLFSISLKSGKSQIEGGKSVYAILDDDGLLKGGNGRFRFVDQPYDYQTFAGRMLLVRMGRSRIKADMELSVEDLERMIEWQQPDSGRVVLRVKEVAL